MNISISNHASIRMQQRGINQTILEYLQEFGKKSHDGHGAQVIRFEKKSKYRLRQTLDRKEYAKIESKLNAYVVMSSDGLVITVGYQNRRFIFN